MAVRTMRQRPMNLDYARWCNLRAKIAHANSDYEMEWLINETNRIDEHWARGPHAAKWFRLRGIDPQYVAHINGEPGRVGSATIAAHPAADLADALAWSRFRLEHMPDTHLHFSITRTGRRRPVYRAHGLVHQVVDELSRWQRDHIPDAGATVR